ncbi:MAG: MFS transporter [Desulfobacterales bacterium]|nr:MFS transporter [Desulfobacterales bacterium]
MQKNKSDFNESVEPSDNHALENSTLIVATFSSFIGPFMISAVNVALPAIQADFKISAVVLSWIATSYLLSTAVFLVPIGKIADIYGHKKFFVLGLSLFVAASFFSAFAPTITILISLRVLQGFSAAMITTTGMAILTSVFPIQRRGRAIGIYVAAVYVGLSVGPTVGGALTHHFGWRSIFLTVVPLGLLSIFIAVKHLKKEWKGMPGEKFDLTGSIIYGFSLVALIYGATLLPNSMAYFIVGFGIIGIIIFTAHEKSIQYPVFELKLFKNNRIFAFSSLAALINYSATFAVTFMMSLYLQYLKGFNPQEAGLILVFQPIVQAAFSPISGRLSDKIEPRMIASIGMSLTVFGLLQLVFLSPKTPVIYIIGILILLGFGFALFSSPNMNAIMSAVEKRYFGIASGVVSTMRLLGQMLSMATATISFAIFLGNAPITQSNSTLFLHSLKIVFLIFALLCMIGIFFSMARGVLRK